MHNEDLRIRKLMESSDLPKLSERFGNGEYVLGIAWKVYHERMVWMMNKFSFRKLAKEFDFDNPLVSLFTWTVMIPVGGTFCVFGWFVLAGLYRKKIRINRVNYSMNQYQKKAFLEKVFKKK